MEKNALHWVPSNSPIGVARIPLFFLPSYSLLNSTLPPGIYTFFFVLDGNANGVFDELTWYDYVTVFLTSSTLPGKADDFPDTNSAFLDRIQPLLTK
jgi:hypothetical protein